MEGELTTGKQLTRVFNGFNDHVEENSNDTAMINTINFDSTVNIYQAGTCVFAVRGCPDSTAYNYHASVNYDDGSCRPMRRGCPLQRFSRG